MTTPLAWKTSRLRRLASVGGSVLTVAGSLLVLLIVTFGLNALSPIDPALAVAGDHASQSTLAQTRRELGLDQPLPVQFLLYLGRLAHGDWGTSRSTGQPVLGDLARALPATLELSTLALLLATGFGVMLGLGAASRPGGVIDGISRFLALVGSSIPIFWLGLVLMALFYARLHWLGGPGRLDGVFQYTVPLTTGFLLIDSIRSGQEGAVANAVSHLALPVLVLMLHALAKISRLTRSSALEELSKEYVTFARSKGVSQRRILFYHVVPNIRGAIITTTALAYVELLEGAVLTETIFAWPGLGRYLATALFAADSPAILGATLVLGAAFILINAAVDALVQLLDPRAK